MKYLILISFIMVSIQLKSQSGFMLYDSGGNAISIDELVVRMDKADILLFGEQHDDSIAHSVQATLFELMHQRYGNRAVLSMEMFSSDVQVVMDEYLGGFITEKQFQNDARVWSNYTDYRPMVEYARVNGLRVICANAAARYANLATRKGLMALRELPASSKAYLPPLPIDTASGAYYQKLMDLMQGHGAGHGHGSYSLIPGQSLWDATMAYFIAVHWNSNKGNKIVHLNGRFHSDSRMGVYIQLKKYAPKARVLVLSAQAVSKLSVSEVDLTLGDFTLATLR